MVSKNKTAIILGGSKGIGKEMAKELKKINFKVLVCSRKEIDTSDLESTKKFIKKFKKADVLILNSGGPPPIKFKDLTIDNWKNILINYF